MTMDSHAWDRRYADPELLWTSEPSGFLVQEAAGLRAGRALDLACGEGRNAVWLAQRGWRVTGVDFSRVALKKARRLAAGRSVRAEWIASDLNDYRPADAAFDLVAVFYLQLPAAERQPIIKAAARAVAAGGVLLLVAHDAENLGRGYSGPQDAAVLYTALDITSDLAATGLEIERAETVERTVVTPEGERVALDLLVRARRPIDGSSLL